MSQALTEEDNGTLREVSAVLLDTCPPGTMVCVETDQAESTIYITTIIPAHPHGEMMHGAAVMGPTPYANAEHGPKPVYVSRTLAVGKPLMMGQRREHNLGIVTKLGVWSTYGHRLGRPLEPVAVTAPA